MLGEELKELTNSQKSIWVTEQFYKGTSINVITGFIKINETVNFHLFNDAIEILIKNTDIFGMHLSYENGELTQVLTTPKNKGIRLINVSCKEELENLQNTIAKTPFNIFEDDLFDFTIFKLPDNTGGVIGRFHHIICDAWATSLIITRIMTIYQNLLNNLSPTEGINFESYVNYIVSEELYVNSPKFKKSKEFWLNTFNSNFSYSYLSSNVSNSCTADRATYSIEKNLAQKLNDFCEVNSISLPLLLISVIGIYLAKINNNSCATIGLPILNRTNFKEKNCAGMFINVAPLRINFKEDIEFKEFVKNIATDSMNMLKHQKYSYQSLLEELRKKDINIPNLYNILLSYQKKVGKICDFEFCIKDDILYMLQYRPVTEIITQQSENDNSKVNGTPASKGVVEGEVCFLEDVDDIDKFKPNTILLTYYTDPDWTEALVRAKAIVTAEGGFLCHTAIIARELGIPCITGIGKKNLKKLAKCKQIVVNGNTGGIKELHN